MGMFDEVYLKCKNPVGCPPDMEFQTKDLDCQMYKYEIREDMRLYKYVCEWEDVPEEERKFKGALSWVGSIREVKGSGKWVDMNYHGIINIYNSEADYYVKFTDGVAEFGGTAPVNQADFE